MTKFNKIILSSVVATALATGSYGFGFGDVSSALSGGKSSSSSKVDADAVLAKALKQIDMAKKLKEDSEKIKKEMSSSMSTVSGMSAITDYIINFENTALTNAKSADQARDVFNQGISNIINATKNSSNSIKDQEKVLASIKPDGTKLQPLLDMSKKDIDKTVKNIEASVVSIQLANAVLLDLGDKADKATQKIDNAIDTFKSKGGSVAIESVKMVAILALEINNLKKTISSVSSNPMQAIKLVPKLKTTLGDITSLITVFKDYKADYDYIENNAVTISKHTKGIVTSIKDTKAISSKFLVQIEDVASKRVDLQKLREETRNLAGKLSQQVEKDMLNIDEEEM